jgi:phosphoribosylpyrophosphate synthetase
LKLSDFLAAKLPYTLDYGALFSYSPYGQSEEEELSRSYRTAIKNDEAVFASGRQVQMSEFVADTVQKSKDALPFGHLFDSGPVLVPARSTSLMKSNSLWVPFRIATALLNKGLGREVSTCLERKYPLQKAATSVGSSRPTVTQQYDSLEVQKLLTDPESILLVDDVVTTGATLIGSAKRLTEAYPKARVAAFAAVRTVSLSRNFKGIDDPVFNKITLYPSGKTHRDPD